MADPYATTKANVCSHDHLGELPARPGKPMCILEARLPSEENLPLQHLGGLNWLGYLVSRVAESCINDSISESKVL